MAREQVARVLIGDGERIAVQAVAGAELALEVRRLQVVWRAGRDGHHPRVLMWPAAWALVHEPATREQIGDGAGGRPVGDARMPGPPLPAPPFPACPAGGPHTIHSTV